jgi:hypothetical protein
MWRVANSDYSFQFSAKLFVLFHPKSFLVP